jgi:hypothetical protein
MVLGLACRVDDGQPLIGLVWLSQGADGLSVEAQRLRPAKHHDRAQQLVNLAADIDTILKERDDQVAVVRTLEAWGGKQRAPHEPSTRLRLWVEGVLLSVGRRHIRSVEPLTGQAIGHACGSNKADVEARARELVESRVELIDACAAALAALSRERAA